MWLRYSQHPTTATDAVTRPPSWRSMSISNTPSYNSTPAHVPANPWFLAEHPTTSCSLLRHDTAKEYVYHKLAIVVHAMMVVVILISWRITEPGALLSREVRVLDRKKIISEPCSIYRQRQQAYSAGCFPRVACGAQWNGRGLNGC